MKKVFLTFIVFAIANFVALAQNTFSFPEISDQKDGELQMTIGERIKKMQIPDDVIDKLSTGELLTICLDFPYNIDIFFYDDFQKGFEILKKEFNGYEELMKRPDLYEVIITKGNSLQKEIERVYQLSEIERGEFSIKWFFFEMIVAQDEILLNFSENTESTLMATILNNKETKENFPSIFSPLNEIPTILSIVKIALQNPELYPIEEDIKDELIDFTYNPLGLNENIIKSVQMIISNK